MPKILSKHLINTKAELIDAVAAYEQNTGYSVRMRSMKLSELTPQLKNQDNTRWVHDRIGKLINRLAEPSDTDAWHREFNTLFSLLQLRSQSNFVSPVSVFLDHDWDQDQTVLQTGSTRTLLWETHDGPVDVFYVSHNGWFPSGNWLSVSDYHMTYGYQDLFLILRHRPALAEAAALQRECNMTFKAPTEFNPSLSINDACVYVDEKPTFIKDSNGLWKII